MENLIAILQTALPVFLALGLGMLCRKTGFLSREAIDALKKVVINLTLPAVLVGYYLLRRSRKWSNIFCASTAETV